MSHTAAVSRPLVPEFFTLRDVAACSCKEGEESSQKYFGASNVGVNDLESSNVFIDLDAKTWEYVIVSCFHARER